LEFRNVDFFCGGRKTGEPGEKPSKQGRESTTNTTHCYAMHPRFPNASYGSKQGPEKYVYCITKHWQLKQFFLSFFKEKKMFSLI
jgi:hypothetical protein